MWEPQPPATLRASTACTGITLPFTLIRRLHVDVSFVSFYLTAFAVKLFPSQAIQFG
jgi:hypothetical protein